jgi:ATP-dependent RNA helicase DHX57
MRNTHMALPPIYRNFWKQDFQELKVEDVKAGRGWMYEADPFAAKLEREEAQALQAKRQEEQEKKKSKEVEPAIRWGGNQDTWAVMRADTRGWNKVPKLELGKRTRASIEELVRKNVVWNPHNTVISEYQQRNIINEFSDLGFRRSHIEEAAAACKDREEALEWLLIHVPEDDLPDWSLPEGYTVGISMASGNPRKDASVQRLAASGFSVELCEKYLDVYNGDEGRAAENLQELLTATEKCSELIPGGISATLDYDVDQAHHVWIEEKGTLESIFGDRFRVDSPEVYNIRLQISRAQAPYDLRVRESSRYPQSPPVVSIIAPGVPAFIRLSMVRELIKKAATDFLQEPMVFNLVDWLETEIPRILENPGRLGDVSAGATGLVEAVKATDTNFSQHQRRANPQINHSPGDSQNMVVLDRWNLKQQNPRQRQMIQGRQSLPAWALKGAIVEAVNNNQVTIISGETGSGKSTQSVQFVLDDMIQRKIGATANIICTQPRRISALGLADRVSDERCSRVGEEVGYAIRGESARKPGVTKITFMTTGVLLRRLQTSGSSPDDVVASLADVSHVFLDEVHERSLDTDFLLVLLRTVLGKRKDFKVILMSATLDAGIFEHYFNQSASVGKIEIQGRTYPVDDYYLDDVVRFTGFDGNSLQGSLNDDEDIDDHISEVTPSVSYAIKNIGTRINYNLIASTVRAISVQLGSQEGGILIFLPGTHEINRALDAISRIPDMHGLPLHASLTPIEQRRVFPLAPKGKRKVIVATNVAETSITIEDIVAVIDLGKVKETSFDPKNNMIKLEEVWASRAACKQRRGRAGRVKAGKCYKLYTRNAEAKMAERPEPEIRRVPLEQLCLSVRAMGIKDVPAFLASALTPPDNMAVEGALELLQRIGALDGDDLTALGRHLSMIPADLRCSKLMVYGATFSCLEACLIIAAILTVRSPIVSPQAKREESKAARSSFATIQGDLLCDLRAYEQWSTMKVTSSYGDIKSWCDQNYLSSQTLNDIASNRSQYLSSLKEAGFLPANYHPAAYPSLNSQNSNSALIRALIAGAFNPQLARIEFPDKKFAPSMSGAVELDPEARTIKFFNQENGRVFVHPSSTLFGAQTFVSGSIYMSYFNKMATSKIFIRELTRKPQIPMSLNSPLPPSFSNPLNPIPSK